MGAFKILVLSGREGKGGSYPCQDSLVDLTTHLFKFDCQLYLTLAIE